MNCLELFARLLFRFRGVSHAIIDAADSENIERTIIEHRRALERVAASTNHSSMANGKLRESIRRARTSAFADFEQSIGGHHGQHH